jgi:N-acetylneuraminic acid mutarotase
MLLRTTLSLLAAATMLTAQNDYNWDKASSGRLGQTLQLQASGAPSNAIMLIVLSFNAGPTPLILLDGVDTRSMQVGVDLLDVIQVVGTSPTGTATFSLPIDTDPSWIGLVLHWQTAIYPMTPPTFLGQISNDIVTQMGPQDTGILAPSSMLTGRGFAASFVDANNNGGAGDVVVAGGGTGSLTRATGLASSEVWDFRRMQMVAGPSMLTSRALHVAVPLTDSRVLIIGGVNNSSVIQSSCELYNPVTNTFTSTGSMATPRMLHAACRLADGRVMVAGGASALDLVNLTVTALSSVEIYNPATGTWSGANAIGGTRIAPALTLLSNNQVMVSGGAQITYFLGIPISTPSTTAVQRWNPATGTWTSGPNMSQARAFHHYNQVTLADGRVLMTGGINVPSLPTDVGNATPISGAELYNPTTNSWATVNMSTARAMHTATRLASGRVVVCGGAQGTLSVPSSIDGVEVFNPATNTWSPAPALTAPRAGHAAALTPDGTLVLFGGQDSFGATATIETLRF